MANPSSILLELWAIDQRRRELRAAREVRSKQCAVADAAAAAAKAAADKAAGEVERTGALTRQYAADVVRCDERIKALRDQQAAAKTNKAYMDIINGIEEAKSEKAAREASVKELDGRIDALKAAAAKAAEESAAKAAAAEQARSAAGDTGATPEEQELDAQHAEKKAQLEPAFIECYERLIKSGSKMPLVRVDPRTRATPYGQLLSHNQLELIRAGKLVTDRTSNGIYYIP